jgi:hypothetical protein
MASANRPSLVANPKYEQLERLLRQLQKSETMLANALRNTCTRMGSNKVWIGPQARAWDAKIRAYDAQLHRQVSGAIETVQAQLAATPKEINSKTQALTANPRF